MLGDINLAEPEALIGFAGPRVIEQTVRETLPEGLQRSEFLLDHGAIDQICDRRELRDRIATLLALLRRQPQPEDDTVVEANPLAGRISAPMASAAASAKARSRPTSCPGGAVRTATRRGHRPGRAAVHGARRRG